MEESNLVNVSAPINVVGDVHGQFYDVLKLFSLGYFMLTQAESFLMRSICSSGTMLIGVIIPYKRSCISSASKFHTLNSSISLGVIISLGTIFTNSDKFPVCMAFTRKSTVNMVI